MWFFYFFFNDFFVNGFDANISYLFLNTILRGGTDNESWAKLSINQIHQHSKYNYYLLKTKSEVDEKMYHQDKIRI